MVRECLHRWPRRARGCCGFSGAVSANPVIKQQRGKSRKMQSVQISPCDWKNSGLGRLSLPVLTDRQRRRGQKCQDGYDGGWGCCRARIMRYTQEPWVDRQYSAERDFR